MAKQDSEKRPMNPTAAAKSAKVGRSELCPCGSGKKYKRCCAEEATCEQASSASGRFRYEPGSYGSAVAGHTPSILCYESSGPDSWRDHSLQAESGDIEDFALSLREAGYIRLSDFRRARGS
jgi:hypothetical protein